MLDPNFAGESSDIVYLYMKSSEPFCCYVLLDLLPRIIKYYVGVK